MAGGPTSIQGWPSASRPATNQLVRSVDNDKVGPLSDPVRVSSLTMKREDLRIRAANLGEGRICIYHCAEGQPGSIVSREFDGLDENGLLAEGARCTHTCALDASHYQRWRSAVSPAGGSTAGTVVALGTDWGPSGTRNHLGSWRSPVCTVTRRGGG